MKLQHQNNSSLSMSPTTISPKIGTCSDYEYHLFSNEPLHSPSSSKCTHTCQAKSPHPLPKESFEVASTKISPTNCKMLPALLHLSQMKTISHLSVFFTTLSHQICLFIPLQTLYFTPKMLSCYSILENRRKHRSTQKPVLLLHGTL